MLGSPVALRVQRFVHTLIGHPTHAAPVSMLESHVRSDADFILLVEKEAAYMRMAEDRFYQKYPCIVITAKGQPVGKIWFL